MFENEAPNHWTLSTDTGTQLESPQRKMGVFRPPLSPVNLNSPHNPFQRTPSPKNKSPFNVDPAGFKRPLPPSPRPSPKAEKRPRQLSLTDLFRRSANEDKKKELQQIVEVLTINIDCLTHGASSYYSDPELIKAQNTLSLRLKYILKPALIAALRDPQQRFRHYLIEKALFLDTITTPEISDILENYCGNVSGHSHKGSFDYLWQITRNMKIFTLFLQFDLDRRDVYEDNEWAIHPTIAEAHDFLFGKKELEFPKTLERHYAPVGFFTVQNLETFITEFDHIRDALRNGIMEFGAHPEKLTPHAIEDFILDQAKALIQLRDKIKPGKKEANDLIEAVNEYTDFVCTLREEAKQLTSEEALSLVNMVINKKPTVTI